jgi:hypothetical protein
MDLYAPQEEGAKPKPLIDQLEEGRIKGLLLDTANLGGRGVVDRQVPRPVVRPAEGLVRRGPVGPHQA